MAPSPPEFEQVIATCYNDVYRFALTLTRTEADAKDLTQQAFFKFARKGQQLRDRSKIKSWLFSTLRNEFTDGMRRKACVPMLQIEVEKPSAEPSVDQHTDGRIALAALREIAPLHREPLALYYLEGHTYAEIAGILDIPIGTVMSRLSRGRALLRQKLDSPSTPKAPRHEQGRR